MVYYKKNKCLYLYYLLVFYIKQTLDIFLIKSVYFMVYLPST